MVRLAPTVKSPFVAVRHKKTIFRARCTAFSVTVPFLSLQLRMATRLLMETRI